MTAVEKFTDDAAAKVGLRIQRPANFDAVLACGNIGAGHTRGKEPQPMTLTTIILAVLALYVVQLFLQETSRFGFNLWGIVGDRDKAPEMSVLACRLDRAKNNMLEALPMFLTLAVLAVAKGRDTSEVSHAALVFLIARVVYVSAYVSGIPILRSFIWLVGMGSLLMMALFLIWNAPSKLA